MNDQQPPVMAPEGLPQQRLYLVKDSPRLQWVPEISNGIVGEDGVPRRIPRGAMFIAQAEWAWSPMHNRIDNYHISLDSRHQRWVLWVSLFNDEMIRWSWYTCEDVLVIPRTGIERTTAAQALLLRYWRDQAEEDIIDHFHWLGQAGLLSVGQVRSVGMRVWGSKKAD